MPRAVNYLPAADIEIDEAFAWYLARSPQAAEGFLQSLDEAIHRAATDPQMGAMLGRKARYFRTAGYPYQVIYRSTGEAIDVIAVAHTSRKPGYWRYRLRNLDS